MNRFVPCCFPWVLCINGSPSDPLSNQVTTRLFGQEPLVSPKWAKRLRGDGHCWWFRNPVNSPVEVGSLSHYLGGFIHPKVVIAGFLSTVWCFQDLMNSLKFLIPVASPWNYWSISLLPSIADRKQSSQTLSKQYSCYILIHWFNIEVPSSPFSRYPC